MTSLVTGGAGFIGSHIVAALLGRGESVRVLDDFSTGKSENLQAATDGARGRLEVLDGDLRDGALLARALAGVEAVFHQAAFVSVPASMEDPRRCFDVNCAGTVALLDAARAAGVRRVVLASSAAVYGDAASLPLSEETQARPLSPYAASKLVTEVYARLYSVALGLEVCALRYFNVFGPRQRADTQYAAAVPIFIERLLKRQAPTIFGTGEQSRDLIFVQDVVNANLTAADHPGAPGQVLNVCTGRKTRLLDLLHELYDLLPGAPQPVFEPARKGDILESLGSPAKARDTVGFEATTALRDGLIETVRWMQ